MTSDRKSSVFVGFVGKEKDAGTGPARWKRWRPTVELFRQSGIPGFDRAELLYVVSGRKKGSVHDNAGFAKKIAADIRKVSPKTTVSLHAVPIGDPWEFEQVYAAIYDYSLRRSQKWDTASEEFYIHIGTGTHVIRICLFLLTEARFLPGRLLQSIQPAGDSESGSCAVIDLELKNYDLIAKRFGKRARDNLLNLKSGIATKNAAFNATMRRLEQVASRSRDPILVTGPTGAGKTRLAGRIYEVKKSMGLLTGAFVEVNCATIRGDTAMSALFGHRRGAFTGAVNDRPGLLREANGGMLFLDEIGELGLDEQAMLLRAVESGVFFPVGSDKPASSSFQLVAGSNRDLRVAVAEGRFREDLLARLDLWTFHLPGIAGRREDIEPNLDFELRRTGMDLNLHLGMNSSARKRFLAFAVSPEAVWSTNFRDFSGAIRRMATLSEGGRITLRDVEEEIIRLRDKWTCELAAVSNSQDKTAIPASSGEYATSAVSQLRSLLTAEEMEELEPLELAQLIEALRVCAISRTMAEAGRRLFKPANARHVNSSINYSDRMRKYLHRYRLNWDEIRDPASFL